VLRVCFPPILVLQGVIDYSLLADLDAPLFKPLLTGAFEAESDDSPASPSRTEVVRAQPSVVNLARTSEARASEARASETPSEYPSVSDMPMSRSASKSPVRESSKDPLLKSELIKTIDDSSNLRLLFNWRVAMQKLDQKVRNDGLIAVTADDVKRVKTYLNQLSFFVWPEDKAIAELWIKKSKINKALRLFINGARFTDEIRDMSKQLIARWDARDFAPAALEVEEDLDFLDSDSADGDDGPDSNTGNLVMRPTLSSLTAHLMRGIERYRNAKGNLTMRLLPSADKRRADVFGHNGLQVGEYAATTPSHGISRD
jgi:hypothetical protein